MWRRRKLRALQVEVTSACTRSCSICPRSVLSETWIDGYLSPEHWKTIERDLGLFYHVHLQGWGEPLLHPDLPDWADAARRAGCKVGLTTNGDRLPEAIPWLLEGNVDIVTVSLAGGHANHARLRDGSSFGMRRLPEVRWLVKILRRVFDRFRVSPGSHPRPVAPCPP